MQTLKYIPVIQRRISLSFRSFYAAAIITVLLAPIIMILVTPAAPWLAMAILLSFSICTIAFGLNAVFINGKIALVEKQIAEIEILYPLPKSNVLRFTRKHSNGSLCSVMEPDKEGARVRMRSFSHISFPERPR